MFMMKVLSKPFDAWEPYISAETMSFHYDKHYKGYCDKLNELVKGTRFENMSLELAVKESFNNLPQDEAIYNNAAQMWNHQFFWRSLTLSESEKKEYFNEIDQSFADRDEFKREFKQQALAQFGSGWCWAVRHNGKIEIRRTDNADGPLTMDGVVPLFCLDVWEHAYYLDYQNRRGDFIDAFFKCLG